MVSFSRTQRWLFPGLLLIWAFSHVQLGRAQADDPVKEESKAEKVRQALDRTLVLDFTGNSINDVLNHLKEKAKVNFALDVYAAGSFMPLDDGMGMGNPNPQITLKSEKGAKLRQTLQRFLTPYNLSYVILDDAVLITTEELGLYRQMRQRVSVDVKDQPLRDALKDLARTTGINLLLDPRVAKEAAQKVSLQLDDATLETAVKLLAEMGDLKAVRMGNVLFVTSEARAEKIRKEENQNPMPNPMRPDGMVFPGGFGNGGAAGGFGMGIGGLIGAGVGRQVNPAIPGNIIQNAPPTPLPAPPPPPPDMNNSQFSPFAFVNRNHDRLSTLSTPTPELNLPLRSSTFDFSVPPFGGYPKR